MSLNNILDASGSIQLGMSATETKALPVGSYVYDILITTGSVNTRIAEGVVSVFPHVS
jgi:hypothetical protein